MIHSRQILFIQGGGDGGYEADKILADSLQTVLGGDYDIVYPDIRSDESAPNFGWTKQLDEKIAAMPGEFILVGHSFGASMLLKYLSESAKETHIKGLFLIATPFWSGDEDWVQGLKLRDDFADKLPKDVPMFFYHCKDDEEIPVSHLEHYKKKLPDATFRILETGGHQLYNDLTAVADDIKRLTSN